MINSSKQNWYITQWPIGVQETEDNKDVGNHVSNNGNC